MTFAQIRNYIKGLFNPILDSIKHDIDDAKVTSMSFNDFNKLPQSVKDNGKAYFIPDVNFNINTNNVTYTQTGFTPIGTIISVMGNSAPTHYLACDGSIYNISDYQDLANYFKEQFGSENYFGGDGIDTFAVPDMTDKFMKGSTTAGTSEDAGLPNITGALTGTSTTYQDLFDSANFTNNSALYCTYDNINRQANSNVAGYYTTLKGISFSASRNNAIYGKSNTVTPNNISVLYCIAVRDIYIDAKNDYSTTEKVIGTWINGKPLYQKTFYRNTSILVTVNSWTTFVSTSIPIEVIVGNDGWMLDGEDILNDIGIRFSSGNIKFMRQSGAASATTSYITLRYTKTTD